VRFRRAFLMHRISVDFDHEDNSTVNDHKVRLNPPVL